MANDSSFIAYMIVWIKLKVEKSVENFSGIEKLLVLKDYMHKVSLIEMLLSRVNQGQTSNQGVPLELTSIVKCCCVTVGWKQNKM